MRNICFFAAVIALCAGCTTDRGLDPATDQMTSNNTYTSNADAADSLGNHFTLSSTVADVISDPAFEGFGRLLFPVDRHIPESMTLEELSSPNVYIWYSHIDPHKTVEILNYLRGQALEGNRIFYPIYTEEEIAADPSKADTGLFFFRGNADAPFALVNAGGGFAYVAAMHDSFPHALEISRAGFNSFALIYRPDDPYADLARALEVIVDGASALQVKPTGYSLWGGSAGARMAATGGNSAYIRALTGRQDFPAAAAVIMQYTGYTSADASDAPTYANVGSADGIASWRTMKTRIDRLGQLGIPTEFHLYEGLGHGYGLGTGTAAQGWVADALAFWRRNIPGGDSGIRPVTVD